MCGYIISWYSLTVAVRLMITLLSLVTDCTVLQLAKWLHGNRDAVSAAVVMATSYISLVYYTRTFSNTLESFLYAALLYALTRRSHKEISDFMSAVTISALIVVGVFNRPTFVIYAAVPYLWWLFSDGVSEVIARAVNSMLTAVPVSVLLTMCDSLYFGQLDINKLNIADLSDIVSFVTNNLTVTPLNFVLYNTQFGNLAEHGIHPRFTHFIVNLPLLFSVLSIYFFCDVYRWCMTAIGLCDWKFVSMYWQQLVLLLCCIVPVILLSLFPHQEPRFLIPLLPIFAAAYAPKITASRGMMVLWVVANMFGCLFYGCIHQAGVVPCLGHLQQSQSTGVDRHVVFWHTYTAPQHLLLLPRKSSQTQDAFDTGAPPLVSLEGNSVEDLMHHLVHINSSQSSQRWEKPEVMVAAPSSEHHYLVCIAAEAGIQLDLNQSFWPHLSTEHPPHIDDILCHVPTSSCYNNAAAVDYDDFCNKTLIERLRFLTSLNLYRVNFL